MSGEGDLFPEIRPGHHNMQRANGRFGSWPRDNALEGCRAASTPPVRCEATVSSIFFDLSRKATLVQRAAILTALKRCKGQSQGVSGPDRRDQRLDARRCS